MKHETIDEYYEGGNKKDLSLVTLSCDSHMFLEIQKCKIRSDTIQHSIVANRIKKRKRI